MLDDKKSSFESESAAPQTFEALLRYTREHEGQQLKTKELFAPATLRDIP